jgi:hypothetical protein
MADALQFTRRDGTTEIFHIGSPYLAVVFEDKFKRSAESANDNAWMAFYDEHDRAPNDHAELVAWLKPFIATDVIQLTADPTAAMEPEDSSPT